MYTAHMASMCMHVMYIRTQTHALHTYTMQTKSYISSKLFHRKVRIRSPHKLANLGLNPRTHIKIKESTLSSTCTVCVSAQLDISLLLSPAYTETTEENEQFTVGTETEAVMERVAEQQLRKIIPTGGSLTPPQGCSVKDHKRGLSV